MPSQQDRDKRRIVFCQTPNAIKNWQTGREREESCGPDRVFQAAEFIPEEGTFFRPQEPTDVRVSVTRPPGIVLYSPEKTVTCPNPQPGFPIVSSNIPYGEYFYNISYEDIPDITDEQLYFIATLDQGTINNTLSDGNLEIIQTLGLDTEQEQYLAEAVMEGLSTLITTVDLAGIGILLCTYYNENIVVCCPEGSVIEGSEQDNCITIEAGVISSTLSVQDANGSARAAALQSLENRCVVGNDPVIVYCEPGLYGEPAIVAENTYFARTKEDANALALAHAQSELLCLICNEAQVVRCPAGSITPDFVLEAGTVCATTPEDLQAIIEDILSNEENCLFANEKTKCSCKELDPTYDATEYPGFEAEVPSGLFEGETVEEVNELAKEECISLLVCGWINDCIAPCPVVDTTQPLDPSGCPPKPETPKGCAVEPGVVFSEESKLDANERAIAIRGECPVVTSCQEGQQCLSDDYLASTDQPTAGTPCNIVVNTNPCNGEKSESFFFCGIVKPDGDGGGGGGGGNGDEPCEAGCMCLTKEQAEALFGKDNLKSCEKLIADPDNPGSQCGVIIGDPDKGIPDIPKFCFGKKEGPPPPPPPATECEAPCVCGDYAYLQTQHPGKEIVACGGESKSCGTPDPNTGEQTSQCWEIKGDECPSGCMCADYNEMAAKYGADKVEPCGSGPSFCGPIDDYSGQQMKTCFTIPDGKDDCCDYPTSGCEDGGTGEINLRDSPAGATVPLLQWDAGCTKTEGNLTIQERLNDPQVRVGLKDGKLTIEGNGNSGSRTLLDCDGNVAWKIEWEDGLIISSGHESYKDSCDQGFNNFWPPYPFVNPPSV
jgi:hypothetical protein